MGIRFSSILISIFLLCSCGSGGSISGDEGGIKSINPTGDEDGLGGIMGNPTETVTVCGRDFSFTIQAREPQDVVINGDLLPNSDSCYQSPFSITVFPDNSRLEKVEIEIDLIARHLFGGRAEFFDWLAGEFGSDYFGFRYLFEMYIALVWAQGIHDQGMLPSVAGVYDHTMDNAVIFESRNYAHEGQVPYHYVKNDVLPTFRYTRGESKLPTQDRRFSEDHSPVNEADVYMSPDPNPFDVPDGYYVQ